MKDKPVVVDFFLPNTPEKEIKEIQSKAVSEAVSPVVAASQAPADDLHEPERILERLIRRSAPPGMADQLVNEALRERNNAHVKQCRMIEMEQRRARRAQRKDGK